MSHRTGRKSADVHTINKLQTTKKLRKVRPIVGIMSASVVKPKHRPVADDVSPAEIGAVEAALRHLESQHKTKHVLGQVAQWFLVQRMYKDLEVSFARSKNRKTVAAQHKALLAMMMGLGQYLLNESQAISESEFALISSSRESLAANVRYLQEKYEQWFVEIDVHEMKRVWGKLSDEREVSIRDDIQA
jgi:hypothetical protein